MAYSPGTRLGPYEVRSFISAGGMGEVYAAFDPRLGRQVAIKVLSTPLAELGEFRRRFERETQAISRLNHKNICTVHDTGTHEGRPYIVMELMEGKTLEELLRAGPLDTERVVHVAIQVADALDAAHRQGVIHRDVKSSNIFLNARGDAKVLDFGIAKVARPDREPGRDTDAGITRSGVPIGTLAFMSPEQARGEEVDERSDLFSLGVVLYEMATGVTPLRVTATSSIAQLVPPDPIPGPRAVNPSLPVELDRIINRALEKDRRMRWQTAADLLAALRGLRRDLGMAGGVPPQGESRSRPRGVPSSVRRLAWGGAGAVAVVVAAAFAWRALAPDPLTDRPIRSMAVLPCADGRGEAGRGYLCSLLAERIITSLSQVPGLTVLAYQTVAPFAGDPRGAIAVGEELGVDAVLTAQVRAQPAAQRVTVEVTDVRSGIHVWGSLFRSPAPDVGGMQDEIALDVAENLQLRLSSTDRERLRIIQTYQQAEYYWRVRTAGSLEKAIGLFTEVIEADSTFARAYVGLANAYTLLHYYGDLKPSDSYPRARVAIERARALDESLADGHANLGLVMRDYDRDWKGAEREFQRALQLDPGSADALQWYAELLTMVGRFDEAEQRILAARRARPNDLAVQAVHGWVLMSAGRFDEARRELEATIAKDPAFQLSHWFLGQLEFAQGDYAAAVGALDSATALTGRQSRRVADLAAASAFAGRQDRALELLGELERRSAGGEYVSRYDFAIVRAGLGQKDRAFRELEEALEERTWQVVNMGIDPMLAPLRSDPRFGRLLVRAGLPGR
ncbi:MAG: tetratricopeptide repeat protein [Gemmatimonadetes bacterium]|nr:tetratricopeptide repeat protein [Gemmatimonadota bacterium]